MDGPIFATRFVCHAFISSAEQRGGANNFVEGYNWGKKEDSGSLYVPTYGGAAACNLTSESGSTRGVRKKSRRKTRVLQRAKPLKEGEGDGRTGLPGRTDPENTIIQKEFCGAEQMSTSYLRCLLYLLEEWTGVERLGEYLSYLIIFLLILLLIGFLLPVVIFLFFVITTIFVYIYKRKTDINEGYLNDCWDGVRQMVATAWYVHARIWNGYEVHGLEKLPDGPALIIHYHGATFLDIMYLSVIIFIRKKKILNIVADHFLFSVPGMKFISDVLKLMPGSQEECKKVLENGELLMITPGGVREAIFSDENYTIIWKNRKGFAQVAIDAKVPIIPTFTQNIRENIRIVGGQIRLLRWIYEYFRLPIYPLYGNFPVKLQTYFGDPIPYDPNITAEELAKKAKNALRCLIDKHQKIPGNVWRALMERVTTEKQDNE